MSVEDILIHFDDILHVSGITSSFLRSIGGAIIHGLLSLISVIEKVTLSVLTSNDFFQYNGVIELRADMRGFIFALMGVTVILIGYQLIFNKIEKRRNIVLNGLLSILFLVGGPVAMDSMNKITTAGVMDLNAETQGTVGEEIVKNNLADISYYAEQGFNVETPDKKRMNVISPENITYINFTEVVDIKNVSNEVAKDALKKRLVVQTDNSVKAEDLDNGLFGYFKEQYYRWDINWGIVIISLLVTVIALLITIVKVGRIIFDIAFHGIFGSLVAATDISGGQRLKKIVNEIFSSYIVIFLMALLLKLFLYYTGWLATKDDLGVVGWGNVLLLVAGSWALIDAPNIVERILGIDAGLSSGWKTLVGAAAATKMIGSATKNTSRLAMNTSRLAWNTGKGIKNRLNGYAVRAYINASPESGSSMPGMDQSQDKNLGTIGGTGEVSQNEDSPAGTSGEDKGRTTIEAPTIPGTSIAGETMNKGQDTQTKPTKNGIPSNDSKKYSMDGTISTGNSQPTVMIPTGVANKEGRNTNISQTPPGTQSPDDIQKTTVTENGSVPRTQETPLIPIEEASPRPGPTVPQAPGIAVPGQIAKPAQTAPKASETTISSQTVRPEPTVLQAPGTAVPGQIAKPAQTAPKASETTISGQAVRPGPTVPQAPGTAISSQTVGPAPTVPKASGTAISGQTARPSQQRRLKHQRRQHQDRRPDRKGGLQGSQVQEHRQLNRNRQRSPRKPRF
ncbi:pLS20_p028 family conjugation system transmembrane protein [Paenibacillus larvae]